MVSQKVLSIFLGVGMAIMPAISSAEKVKVACTLLKYFYFLYQKFNCTNVRALLLN